MIAAILAAAILQQTGVRTSVLELPDPNAETVTIHAYLVRDGRYAREDAAWQILCRTIGKNSTVFGASDVAYFGGTAGTPPRTYASPDFIRLEVSASPEHWTNAVEMAVSLLSQPNWRANSWDEELKAERSRTLDPWDAALWPIPALSKEILEEDLVNVHARILDESGITFVISGPFERGQAKAEVDKFAQRIEIPRHNRIPKFAEEAPWPQTRSGNISSFEVRGKPIRIGAAGSAEQFLALVALSVGKDSAIWQDLREEKGLAYTVEGLFWPSREGFVPRIIMLRSAEESELKYSAPMLDSLRSGAEKFDQDTLVRAQAMARQILTSPSPFSCVYTDGSATLYGSPTDDLRWRGLLFAMGADSISLTRWLQILDSIELDGLKTGASALLDGAEFRLVRGQDRSASN